MSFKDPRIKLLQVGDKADINRNNKFMFVQ